VSDQPADRREDMPNDPIQDAEPSGRDLAANAEGSTHKKTVLGEECRITGELLLDDDAVVMGHFTGTLRVTGVLELTESSQVKGTIVAGAVRLGGSAEADVISERGVWLAPTAELYGQVFTRELNVAEGASFRGELSIGVNAIAEAQAMLEQAEAQARTATSAQAGHGDASATREADAAASDQQNPAGSASKSSGLDTATERDKAHSPAAPQDHNPTARPAVNVASSVNEILQRRSPKVINARGLRLATPASVAESDAPESASAKSAVDGAQKQAS